MLWLTARKLKSKHSSDREHAIDELEKEGGSEAVEYIAPMLRDAEHSVRQSAASALGRIGDPRAVGPLLECIDDQNSYVRSAVARALGRIAEKAPEEVLPRLQDRMRVCSGTTRAELVYVLCRFGDPRYLQLLQSAMQDRAPEVRKQAAWALGENYGNRSLAASVTIPQLMRLLSDDNLSVVATAVGALDKLADGSKWAESPEVRSVVPNLVAGLRRPTTIEDSAESRWRACGTVADLLGRIGDPRAIDVLAEAVWKEFPFHAEAAEALIRLDPKFFVRAKEGDFAREKARNRAEWTALSDLLGRLPSVGIGDAKDFLSKTAQTSIRTTKYPRNAGVSGRDYAYAFHAITRDEVCLQAVKAAGQESFPALVKNAKLVQEPLCHLRSLRTWSHGEDSYGTDTFFVLRVAESEFLSLDVNKCGY